MTRSPAANFEDFAQDVYAWAYRFLGRHHDALDVVQTVFLKWNQHCRAEPPRNPRGWLRRVTLNQLVDQRRHEIKSAQVLGNMAKEVDVEVFDQRTLDSRLLRSDIRSAMNELSAMQRAVLVAKVYDGTAFARIAEELELSVSTVKTHYLRAIRVMCDRLCARWNKED